eukprot:CAMPEP_0185570898 /NCGR_PEP_ID=MMETSP0434-20130131/3031_1 /TAXON_ID=626734 ORGANISM="Favella taraikaensis, Strain Fe Narragansett Bay" /NCGR_SAMPLE_ID=MMETSP0434 /ASSEMBLY_ACC=CAM_ASM_000379 /LENGTH=124 /DNA_ID=CAMNT_0028186119 /DNA_START=330 /DNA_END=704 /DNA_ORIENTATION=+
MHEQVNADHFVELVDAQASNSLENSKENRAEDRAPRDNHQAAQGLSLNHRKTASVDQAEVFVENSDCKAPPEAGEAENLEATDRIVYLVAVEELAGCHGAERGYAADNTTGADADVVAGGGNRD